MSSLAVPQTRVGSYSIELPVPIRQALAALPPPARAAILRRLAEIAHVASELRSWMTDAADDLHSTLYFQLSGYAVSYALSDARRMLQVLGVVPITQPGERDP